jgi:hypothetical protein
MARKTPTNRGAFAGYNFATGAIDTNPPPTVDNPDFSKLSPMRPMASHKTTRPTKRSPAQRALISGGR